MILKDVYIVHMFFEDFGDSWGFPRMIKWGILGDFWRFWRPLSGFPSAEFGCCCAEWHGTPESEVGMVGTLVFYMGSIRIFGLHVGFSWIFKAGIWQLRMVFLSYLATLGSLVWSCNENSKMPRTAGWIVPWYLKILKPAMSMAWFFYVFLILYPGFFASWAWLVFPGHRVQVGLGHEMLREGNVERCPTWMCKSKASKAPWFLREDALGTIFC